MPINNNNSTIIGNGTQWVAAMPPSRTNPQQNFISRPNTMTVPQQPTTTTPPPPAFTLNQKPTVGPGTPPQPMNGAPGGFPQTQAQQQQMPMIGGQMPSPAPTAAGIPLQTNPVQIQQSPAGTVPTPTQLTQPGQASTPGIVGMNPQTPSDPAPQFSQQQQAKATIAAGPTTTATNTQPQPRNDGLEQTSGNALNSTTFNTILDNADKIVAKYNDDPKSITQNAKSTLGNALSASNACSLDGVKKILNYIKVARAVDVDPSTIDKATNNLNNALTIIFAAAKLQNIQTLSDIMQTIKAENIKINNDAKKALAGSLKTIATKIEGMDNPSEAAKAAKDLAEAINAADKAGIPVNDAKKALANSLKTIAPKVIDLSTDKASEAVTNLGNAIKTAGLELKGIGNAGIMCTLVADGTLKPTGNGEFTVGTKSGFPDGTNGRIWLGDKGVFQMEITGKYDKTMLQALDTFKELINKHFLPEGKDDPIKIDAEALIKSLDDTQKALKKNAFIFYDFTGKPPIMFTQRKNHFGKLESSALSYDGSAWQEIKKPKSDSTAPDFTGTSQQHSDSSQLKINTNNVINANSNDSENQLERLLEILQAYRDQAKQSAAKKQQAQQPRS